jgi:hypothetical protein
MYLCSWEQDYMSFFYTPSWVLSDLLMDKDSENLQSYKLIAEFYHYFAERMQLHQLEDQISN